MSVVIKGMNMPKNCDECPFCEKYYTWDAKDYCKPLEKYISIENEGIRCKECPLEEVTKMPKETKDDAYKRGYAKGYEDGYAAGEKDGMAVAIKAYAHMQGEYGEGDANKHDGRR